MARRVSLPSADDLFRPTVDGETPADQLQAVPATPDAPNGSDASDAHAPDAPGASGRRRPSGRVRHDETMTIYVTAAELLDIEDARLSLRRDHGLAVDRGRLVREAIALALAEMEHEGADSAIVQRLSAS